MSVSEVTRRHIIDGIKLNGIYWAGKLNPIEFLGELFPLHLLPSADGRYDSAEGDIYQHTIRNEDYERDWIFTDDRFDLMGCDGEVFLAFLCRMIHPLVREYPFERTTLLDLFNEQLERDGWEIVETMRLSGRPIFAARRLRLGPTIPVEGAKRVASEMNTDYVLKQITRMEKAIEDDPELAIGTGRDLIESVCKTILSDKGISVGKSANLPELTRAAMRELKLMPDDIDEAAKGSEIIKRILMNLATVGQGMAELRGLYGSGHGKHGTTKGLKARHAQLAAGASSTLAVFLFQTYMEQKSA